MTMRFGPWDDALNREMLGKIKEIVHLHRKQDEEDDRWFLPQDAINAVGDVIDETEGPDWEDNL